MQGIDRIRSWHGELVRVPWQRQLTTWPDEGGDLQVAVREMCGNAKEAESCRPNPSKRIGPS